MYVFKKSLTLPIGLSEAWDFFSSPNNLPRITPPEMQCVITSDPAEKMYPGLIITYRMKPLPGIPVNWVTEITHVREPFFFVDDQRSGPFKMWHHKHYFKPIPGGVLCEDVVHYRLPMGFPGRIMNRLVVREQLEKIFNYRERVLVQTFGKYDANQNQKEPAIPMEELIAEVGNSAN